MWNFYTILLQIHSGNCLQKIGILDRSLIKLLQNEQGCNFFASQCIVGFSRLADRMALFPVRSNSRRTAAGRYHGKFKWP